MGHDRLRGKRAVVTGADSGIGRAVAIAFAREGAEVLVTHLPEEAADARATAELAGRGGRVILHAADLRMQRDPSGRPSSRPPRHRRRSRTSARTHRWGAGHPVEVAAAYVFLASDEASHVSGTVLGMTGGKPFF